MKRFVPAIAALLATVAPGAAQARVVFLNFFGSSNGFTVSGVLNYDTNSSPYYRSDAAGSSTAYYYGSSTPISINGVGYTLPTSYYVTDAFLSGSSDQFYASGSGYTGSTYNSFSLNITDGLSMLSSTALPTSLTGGTGSLSTYISNGGFSQSTTLPVSFSLSFAGVSAVPEPASWLLTILGVGAVGGMLRRRRMGSATPAYA